MIRLPPGWEEILQKDLGSLGWQLEKQRPVLQRWMVACMAAFQGYYQYQKSSKCVINNIIQLILWAAYKWNRRNYKDTHKRQNPRTLFTQLEKVTDAQKEKRQYGNKEGRTRLIWVGQQILNTVFLLLNRKGFIWREGQQAEVMWYTVCLQHAAGLKQRLFSPRVTPHSCPKICLLQPNNWK